MENTREPGFEGRHTAQDAEAYSFTLESAGLIKKDLPQ